MKLLQSDAGFDIVESICNGVQSPMQEHLFKMKLSSSRQLTQKEINPVGVTLQRFFMLRLRKGAAQPPALLLCLGGDGWLDSLPSDMLKANMISLTERGSGAREPRELVFM
ncbi:hypothetical protein ACHAXN_000239 [Cyclotella atomus]